MRQLALFLVALAGLIATPCNAQTGPRMALLVGNWDYNGNGQFDSQRTELDDSSNYLPDLRNPCSDVEAIEAQLILLGWQEQNIVKVCNVDRLQMIALLDDFVAKFGDTEDPLGFIYYSGHGIQIRSSSYIFGVKDAIDIERTANRIEQRPEAEPLPTSGVDIISVMQVKLGRVYSGTLLLALDACRDNPVLEYIRIKRRNIPVTAPRTSNELQGMVIAYSTTAGDTSDDGAGETSPFAEEFAKAMTADATLDEVINAAAFEVDQRTAYSGKRQTPSKQGTFRPPRRCFAEGCGRQASFDTLPPGRMALMSWEADRGFLTHAVATSPGVGGIFPDAMLIKAGMQESEAASAVESAPTRAGGSKAFRPQRVYQAETPTNAVFQSARSLGMRVDVIWCEGAEDAAANEARANHISSQIAALASRDRFAREALGTVWVAPLGREINREAGFGYSDNVVTYSRGDPRSARLARLIKGVAGDDFGEDAYLENSSALITVYVCEAALEERPNTVYFHVPDKILEPYARTLLEDIRTNVPNLTVASGIETVGSSPRSNQVRYFRPEDAAAAERIAARLQEFASISITTTQISGYETRARPGLVEVWLGRNPAGSQ